jgi:hypothetical protein
MRTVVDGETTTASYSSTTSTLPRNVSTIARCHEMTRVGDIQGVRSSVETDMTHQAERRSASRPPDAASGQVGWRSRVRSLSPGIDPREPKDQ